MQDFLEHVPNPVEAITVWTLVVEKEPSLQLPIEAIINWKKSPNSRSNRTPSNSKNVRLCFE